MKSLSALPLILMTSCVTTFADPFLVAHRGASADAPENTLPAFHLAWEQGADAIEGDFHLTSDGKIVCIHDYDTKKVAGEELVVKDSTLDELRALDVGSWKHRKFAGTRIPTLREVLDTVPPGKQIFIEIKAKEPDIVPVLLTDIRESPIKTEQVTCISFHPKIIRELKQQAPDVTANWLLSFKGRKGYSPAKDWQRIVQTLREIGADGLGSNTHARLDADYIGRLQAAGFQHHVWTVNDALTARRFLKIGTRTITTDEPGKLRKALTE